MDSIPDLTNLEGFEWDLGNLEHIKRHYVNFRECEAVFFNKPLILNQDEFHSQREQRLRVYGISNKRRFLFLIYTVRNNKIRVITARDQSKKERKEFLRKAGEINEQA